jgi:hypothetical protein
MLVYVPLAIIGWAVRTKKLERVASFQSQVIVGFVLVTREVAAKCAKMHHHVTLECDGIGRRGFQFYAEELDGEKAATFIVETRNSRLYKACAVYWRCLDDRDAGKVKHCYENDKRWRDFFTGWW